MNGIAISAKTLNTQTAARLAKPKQIFNSLKGNVDAASRFEGYMLDGFKLTRDAISARQVHVAVPEATNAMQWKQIQHAIEYGASRNVELIITPVR